MVTTIQSTGWKGLIFAIFDHAPFKTKKRSEENWNRTLQLKIEIPMTVLRLFDENGDLISYCNNESLHASDSQSQITASISAS